RPVQRAGGHEQHRAHRGDPEQVLQQQFCDHAAFPVSSGIAIIAAVSGKRLAAVGSKGAASARTARHTRESGYSVITGAGADLESPGILDRPLSRAMTIVGGVTGLCPPHTS